MTHRRRLAMGIGLVVALLVGWWIWPTVTAHDELDVLVLGDDALVGGRRPAELRIREDGRSTTWEALDGRACDDPGVAVRQVDAADPSRVVLWSAAPDDCLVTLATALRDRRPLVVAVGASAGDALRSVDAVVVDPTRLVGEPVADLRVTCEWWEACDPDGSIAIRDGSGALNDAGYERVARMVVGAM